MPKINSIVFIYPRFKRFYQTLSEWSPRFAGTDYEKSAETRTPPCLAFPLLAAMTPPHIEIRFHDDRVSSLDELPMDSDLYAIHIKTEMATRAYELADHLRANGKTVVLGGLHPSACPTEAKAHADAVCVGEAEGVWQEILRDHEAGALKPVYQRAKPVPMDEVAIPRRDIYDGYRYSNPVNYVQVARGCPRPCFACPLPMTYGKEVRTRSLSLVEEELRALVAPNAYLTDDNLLFGSPQHMKYCNDLLRVLTKTGKRSAWCAAIGMPVRRDPEFLRLAKEARLQSIYNVLLDPFSQMAYDGDPASVAAFREVYQEYREAGIEIWFSVYAGTDDHDRSSGEKIVRFLEHVDARVVEFIIPTPYPETPLWKQIVAEKRLLHTDWGRYDGLHTVFTPAQMTPDELDQMVREMYLEFYRDKPYIFDRKDVDVFFNP
jgi:radical SAM superfamily enzyme YgiQ (UPF0313 family)